MKTSENTKELYTALAKAQVLIKNPELNKTNPHFKSKYADLPEVRNVSKQVLHDHGLSIVQGASRNESEWVLKTRLLHTSGEWLETEMPLLYSTERNAMQSLCGAVTYARRYSWVSILGICADEDQDGNDASPPPRQQQKKQEPPKQRTIENPVADEHIDILVTDYSTVSTAETYQQLRQQVVSVWANLTDTQRERVSKAGNDAKARLGIK